MTKLLILRLMGLPFGEKRHAQQIIREFGITYQKAVPQSICDSWDFWNCKNLPENLPSYIEIVDADPYKYIGYGLSEDDAKMISESSI